MYECSTFNGSFFINGQWLKAESGEMLPVKNSATGEHVADVALCKKSETTKAIQTASDAWPQWKATTAKHRHRLLNELPRSKLRGIFCPVYSRSLSKLS